jgi:acetyl esterase/lipase
MRRHFLPPLLVAVVAAVACFFVAAPVSFGQARRPTLPKGFTAEYDVKYIPNGDPAQSLDVYYPEKAPEKPLPLLIWIHGGGWMAGSKSEMPYMSELQRGYVLASIEYRFSNKALFPAQIQDCQAAIRWLRGNAKKYHIDPDHIGVGGASAGGHLSALVGTSGGKNAFPALGESKDQSDRVQAVCDIFGPTDFCSVVKQAEEDKKAKNIFGKWDGTDPYSRLIGGKPGDDKAKCEAVSPVHYVSKDNPPFLILHGDRDTLVPYAQSVELAGLLEKAGVPVVLQRIPNGGHGGAEFALPAVTKLTSTFFDKYLKGVDAKIEPLPENDVTVNKSSAPAKK